ncbi:MAG: SufE family protein [Pseudomonadota bacterium]
MASLETIKEDFAFLDDWEDRYRYVIELGRALPDMDEALKNETTKVRGCASQVWLQAHAGATDRIELGPTLTFEGDSDAHIVKGLIAILLALYNGKSARAILDTDANAVFAELGLAEHLTQQRSNGLASMVARMRAEADATLA